MWLIDTNSLELKAFHECPEKDYAILSHTWGTTADEPTFQEFQNGKARGKPGFEKVRLCCEQAKKAGLEWAWVDTCCINKESSTELSEAINSMFSWYQKSKICYVYLEDVSCADVQDPPNPANPPIAFQRSRWFTRGWTLQELIAPESLTFFTREWTHIGFKSHLAESLHSITGIDINVLALRMHFLDCSVAQRMSWASRRQTTRLEDSAYCLIGLFNVNLPLLYGEGAKAFLRLQQQIIEQTDDETIFAWTGVPTCGSGLLAPAPEHFVESVNIDRRFDYGERPHYINTNKGLLIECQILPCEMNTYVVPLQCYSSSSDPKGTQIAIFIGRTTKDDQYRRLQYEGKSTGLVKDWQISKARTCKIFIPTDSRGLKLAPNAGLPLVSIISEFDLWYVHRAENEVKSSPLCPGTKQQQFDDTDLDDGRIHHLRTLRISQTTPTLPFERRDLEKGIVVAIRDGTRLNSDFIGYLQFGFNLDFQPVCSLHMQRFRLLPRERDLFLISIHPTLTYAVKLITTSPLKVINCLWDTWTGRNTASLYPVLEVSRSEPLLRRFRLGVDKDTLLNPKKACRKLGSRFEKVELEPLNTPVLFASCTQLKVSFRPLSGLKWELMIREKQRHSSHWIRPGVCTKCLALDIGGVVFGVSAIVASIYILKDVVKAANIAISCSFGTCEYRAASSYLLIVIAVSPLLVQLITWFVKNVWDIINGIGFLG